MWNEQVRSKWRDAKVWIIDEISMVSPEMLQYLEQMIRRIRTLKKDLPGEPFGGLQVIFAGEFFQLPPVREKQPLQEKQINTDCEQFLNIGLAFQAPAWHRANLEIVVLETVFRQGDREFIRMLNGIRTGENPAALEDIAKRCARELHEVDKIKPTVLFPKNDAADDYNLKELNALPDAVVESDVVWIDPEFQRQHKQQIVLDAVDKIVTDEPEYRNFNLHRQQYDQLEGALKHCLALKEITLKVGAQVMLLRNLELKGRESDLVNGSRGVVVGWKSKQEKLAELEMENKRPRHHDLDETIPTSAYKRLKKSRIEFVPIVTFRNNRTVDCIPELFQYPILNVGECRRLQVPLKLAWAITIHKCQEMTLDYVVVNLKDIFAEGQLYVALSRARSMHGLQIIGNASRSYVKVSPRVVEFYKALARKEAHLVPQLRFPDLVFDFTEEEIVQPARKYTRSTTQKPFEKVPEEVFVAKNLLPVTCYHCNKEGHPAWACKLGKLLRINS